MEIITGVERRRRWSAAEKSRIVAETEQPGAGIAKIAVSMRSAEVCYGTGEAKSAADCSTRRHSRYLYRCNCSVNRQELNR